MCEGMGEGIGDGVGEGIGDGVGEGVGDGMGEGMGDGVGEGMCEGMCEGMADGVDSPLKRSPHDSGALTEEGSGREKKTVLRVQGKAVTPPTILHPSRGIASSGLRPLQKIQEEKAVTAASIGIRACSPRSMEMLQIITMSVHRIAKSMYGIITTQRWLTCLPLAIAC